MKLTKKIPDSNKTEEYYRYYLNKKKITLQPKLTDNSNIFDLKSVTIRHPKTSHKLPKTIKQAEIIGSGENSISPFYRATTKLTKKKKKK